MNISRALKMRPLFQEVTEVLPEVPFLKSRYQMKDMGIIFPIDTPWVVVGQTAKSL